MRRRADLVREPEYITSASPWVVTAHTNSETPWLSVVLQLDVAVGSERVNASLEAFEVGSNIFRKSRRLSQ